MSFLAVQTEAATFRSENLMLLVIPWAFTDLPQRLLWQEVWCSVQSDLLLKSAGRLARGSEVHQSPCWRLFALRPDSVVKRFARLPSVVKQDGR